MKNSTAQSKSCQEQKRNLGYVQLRRGLRDHLHRSRMTSNASTLFVWLLLSARHSGPTRGCVEANYDDLVRGLGWSYSMVRRTVEELISNSYISVTPASNQHGLTVIKILKFDGEENDSAVLTSEQSNNSGVLTAVLSAAPTGEHCSEQSRPSILQNQRDLQVRKNAVEVKKEKNDKQDGVRRPVDAERLADLTLPFRKEKLQNRLQKKIKATGDSFLDWINSCRKRGEAHPFGAEERLAFEATRYKPDLSSPLLSFDFVMTVVDVFEETRKKDISLGNLCSRIIDRCQTDRERNDGEGYYWPPDFQEHRDRLRAQERLSEHQANDDARATA